VTWDRDGTKAIYHFQCITREVSASQPIIVNVIGLLHRMLQETALALLSVQHEFHELLEECICVILAR
jgi:hypothetical protein